MGVSTGGYNFKILVKPTLKSVWTNYYINSFYIVNIYTSII